MKPMPTGKIHEYWAKKYTGLACPRTHRLIDSWASVLGSKHRVYLHDPRSAIAAAEVADGPQCRDAAINHLLMDEIYNDPELKIVWEMMRLTDTAKPTPDPNSPREAVRAFTGFKQQRRRRW